jgi:6-phosphofructokinase 1
VVHYGEADAYGHRKKLNVGEVFSEEMKKRKKEDTIVSDLTYDLRSGAPDFVDKMVATTFGNMALDAIVANQSGLMTAIVNGCYTMSEIPDPKLGPRKVDLDSMYNTDRYRPNYADKLGLPIFLTQP